MYFWQAQQHGLCPCAILALILCRCATEKVKTVACDKIASPHAWCEFRPGYDTLNAEPVLFKSKSSALVGLDWDSIIEDDKVVNVEFSDTSTFRPHANVHQTSLEMKWALAKKILRGEHAVNSKFVPYVHQQSLVSPTDPILEEIAQHLPKWFSEVAARKVLFWLGGPRKHTSGLHFDALDNIYVVVKGSKEVLLHPPWHAADLGCGGRLLQNSFLLDEEGETPIQSGDMDVETISQLQPRCDGLLNITNLSALAEAGDILWIPTGWFHTVRSSANAVAISIFYKRMTSVPQLLLGLLTPRHLLHPENPDVEDAQEALSLELISTHPDLRNNETNQENEDVDDDEAEEQHDRKVAAAFNRHLSSLSSAHRLQQTAPLSAHKLLGKLSDVPVLGHLAKSLARTLHGHDGAGESPAHTWAKTVLHSLSTQSNASTLLGWWQEVFPGCLPGIGRGSCTEAVQKVAMISSDLLLCTCSDLKGSIEL
eukprot:s1283_g11.t1